MILLMEACILEKLEEVKNYCDDIVCMHSDNDPYVRYESEKNLRIL